MRRHKWESTKVYPEPGLNANSAFAIERCAHCGTERVPDRGATTLYVYRGGGATVAGKSIPESRWTGYTVIPQCVERW